MRFELSQLIRCTCGPEELVGFIAQKLSQSGAIVTRGRNTIEATGINATFGSINSRDSTVFRVVTHPEGFLLVAEVHYRPSVWFWIFVVIGLFTYVLWLIPLAFYLWRRGALKTAIDEILQRTTNEYTSRTAAGTSGPGTGSRVDGIEILTKLAALKEKGHLTQEEFDRKKKELLGF